jgi:hypothetical protein
MASPQRAMEDEAFEVARDTERHACEERITKRVNEIMAGRSNEREIKQAIAREIEAQAKAYAEEHWREYVDALRPHYFPESIWPELNRQS